MTWTTPLLSVASLQALVAEGDPRLRIVDCRWYLGKPGEGRVAYDGGHLPGAVHLDVDGDLAAPPGEGRHPLPDAAAFTERLAAVGIGDGDRVVAYDDLGGWVAARLWWMLDDLGFPDVAVLDGGIQAWVAAGGALTKDVPAAPPTPWPGHRSLSLRPSWSKAIDREALRERLGSLVVLDARAGARYRGEIEPIDAYPGHIPTARSVPTDANLVAPGGSFLPPAALAALYRGVGADGSTPVVVSCGSGVSATHQALAMRAAGLPDPLLYPGSYSDWTRQGWPVVTGDEPGEPPPRDA